MKRGLALEGGGAKGAYHIGVIKAFVENGHEFDGFVGTSIGAVNAAVLAQGDFDKALAIWSRISNDHIFVPDEQPLLQLTNIKGLEINTDFITNVRSALTKVISGKGISTEKMLDFLNRHINEEKVRASGKDFGLVTFSISDRKPYELLLEDIPPGKLIDYIMASASFPGFRSVIVDGKKYVDGGLYNNCPVNLLDKLEYDEIVAIRVGSPGIVTKKIRQMKNVKIISPSEDLGNMMQFSPETSTANIVLGFYDGLRFIKKLRGSYYYINPVEEDMFIKKLMALQNNIIFEVGKIMGISSAYGEPILFEKIIPRLGTHLKLDANFDYADFVIALLEKKAKQCNIERYKLYDYHQLCALVKGVKPNSSKSVKDLFMTPPSLRNEAAIALLSNVLL